MSANFNKKIGCYICLEIWYFYECFCFFRTTRLERFIIKLFGFSTSKCPDKNIKNLVSANVAVLHDCDTIEYRVKVKDSTVSHAVLQVFKRTDWKRTVMLVVTMPETFWRFCKDLFPNKIRSTGTPYSFISWKLFTKFALNATWNIDVFESR